jgi:Flp pilus assembly CpaE family ATPase
MERTVGMPALALIRSGGLLLVRAANAGRTVIEMYPRERITEDFHALAERLVRPGAAAAAVDRTPGGATAARTALKLLVRGKDPARV